MNVLNWFKEYSKDFSTQGGGAVLALFLIFGTGLIVMTRLAIGLVFPDGYDSWLLLLGALAGVSTVGMWAKRATDRDLARIKAGGPSPVTAESGAQVTVEAPAVPTAPVEAVG